MRRSYCAEEPWPLGVGDLPLFEKPVPFQRFSDTSREAAENLSGEVGRLRLLVMEAYIAAGPEGLSADMCAEKLGISILAIRPRVTEAFMAGELVKSGRRVENASGQTARVLVAREHAQPRSDF